MSTPASRHFTRLVSGILAVSAISACNGPSSYSSLVDFTPRPKVHRDSVLVVTRREQIADCKTLIPIGVVGAVGGIYLMQRDDAWERAMRKEAGKLGANVIIPRNAGVSGASTMTNTTVIDGTAYTLSNTTPYWDEEALAFFCER